jgi:glycosyltransferase involved in cell wall biosynthesis
MFLQKERQRNSRKILIHGLDYFGPALAQFMSGEGWNFQYYPDRGIGNLIAMTQALEQCDLVYQIGGRVTVGRFLFATKLLGKQRIVMHWVGSDTMDEKKPVATGKSNPWVLNAIHHWADSEWIWREVTSLGVHCDLVPLPSPKAPAQPSPLPREFCVLVYVPSVKHSELYGLDVILEAARQTPQIQFELVGLRDGPVPNLPGNIRVHNRIPDLTEFYKRASVVWRPTRHDGLSWMVTESLGHGRHVLWTYPFPGCIQVTTASEAAAHLRRLFQMHQGQNLPINEEGVRFIASSEYYPQTFKADLLSRFAKILES